MLTWPWKSTMDDNPMHNDLGWFTMITTPKKLNISGCLFHGFLFPSEKNKKAVKFRHISPQKMLDIKLSITFPSKQLPFFHFGPRGPSVCQETPSPRKPLWWTLEEMWRRSWQSWDPMTGHDRGGDGLCQKKTGFFLSKMVKLCETSTCWTVEHWLKHC